MNEQQKMNPEPTEPLRVGDRVVSSMTGCVGEFGVVRRDMRPGVHTTAFDHLPEPDRSIALAYDALKVCALPVRVSDEDRQRMMNEGKVKALHYIVTPLGEPILTSDAPITEDMFELALKRAREREAGGITEDTTVDDLEDRVSYWLSDAWKDAIKAMSAKAEQKRRTSFSMLSSKILCSIGGDDRATDTMKAMEIAHALGRYLIAHPNLTETQQRAIDCAIAFDAPTPMQCFARVGFALAVLDDGDE